MSENKKQITFKDCNISIKISILSKYPNQAKYIESEFSKLEKFREKFDNDFNYTVNEMTDRLSSFLRDDISEDFEKMWEHNKKYLHHLKENYFEKSILFMEELHKRLDMRENLKEYEI